MENYHTCDDCGRNCYTGGTAYPDGYTCEDCDDDNVSVNTQSECCECESRDELKFFNGKTYCAECRDPSNDSDSEDEEEEREVYGECAECGKEGKFIGKEGDDWICEVCSDACHCEIVFCCKKCDTEIERNSREHDDCWCDDNDDWFCGNCKYEAMEAEEARDELNAAIDASGNALF